MLLLHKHVKVYEDSWSLIFLQREVDRTTCFTTHRIVAAMKYNNTQPLAPARLYIHHLHRRDSVIFISMSEFPVPSPPGADKPWCMLVRLSIG